MGVVMVRSLLACRVTLVPALSEWVRNGGGTVGFWFWASAKVNRFGSGTPMVTRPPVKVGKATRKEPLVAAWDGGGTPGAVASPRRLFTLEMVCSPSSVRPLVPSPQVTAPLKVFQSGLFTT